MKEYKSFNEFKSDLRKECRDYLTTFGITYCKKAADELTETAKYAIEAFYNDYDPTWYDNRTYDLKLNSYKRYYHKKNGLYVSGGVYIGTKYMQPYYRNGEIRDPMLVAATAWETGLHGILGWHVEEGSRGVIPMQIIEDKMKDPKFLNDLETTATKAADAQAGEILKQVLNLMR